MQIKILCFKPKIKKRFKLKKNQNFRLKKIFGLLKLFYCRGGRFSKFLEIFCVKKSCLLEPDWLCFKIFSEQDESFQKKHS